MKKTYISCCDDCHFFEPVTEAGGQCRRYPPKIVDAFITDLDARKHDILMDATHFPVVGPGSWCGEWREGS